MSAVIPFKNGGMIKMHGVEMEQNTTEANFSPKNNWYEIKRRDKWLVRK